MMRSIGKKLKTLGLTLFFACLLMFAVGVSASDVVIVLDPGHGGTETGATRSGYKEEVINQKIANYLKAELETYEGVKVYMTRTSVTQAAQNREERVNIAKVKKANALISLHINSTGANSQTTNTGAYAVVPSTKFTSQSAVISRALGTSILKSLNSMVGLKNNGFWIDDELGIIVFGQKSNYTATKAAELGIAKSVLNVKVPSMIIEHCFINNPNDRKNYLKTDAMLKKMAVADAAGIANYYKLNKKGEDKIVPEHTGLCKIGKYYYLFDSYGNPREGLVKYKGKYYYALEGGKLKTGWKSIGEKRYYFDKTTCAARIGWQKIGKYKYYFSSKGVAKKKWATINGSKYYFSRKTGRLMINYWLKDNGHWYYIGAKGRAVVSKTKKIKGKKYYFDANGICLNR